MSAAEYIETIKTIQSTILEFLDGEENLEENFQNLQAFFDEQQIHENKYELKLVLYLILKVSNNHHRCVNFFHKIEQILNYFKDDITNYFTNHEIFNIFKGNKRILLYLLENNIMTIDEHIAEIIITTTKFLDFKYPQYFQPELKTVTDKNEQLSQKFNSIEGIKNELPDQFYEFRKTTENSEYICQLIQNDSIKEFIAHINKNEISLKSKIKQSIYETNSFLLENQISDEGIKLIDYVIFYGSIQIFNYFISNNIRPTNSSWLYIIHGQNAEIIHYLEDNNIKPFDKSYKECFLESIKCHHLDISNYLLNNIKSNIQTQQIINLQGLKYYNFAQISIKNINKFFVYLCKYDYYKLVKIVIQDKKIDLNGLIEQKKILIQLFSKK